MKDNIFAMPQNCLADGNYNFINDAPLDLP